MAYDWITDALEETWQSIERTLRDRDPGAYDLPTPCPGWCVRDVLVHLFGFELMLRGEPVPAHQGEWPHHVKNPIGEVNEAWVQAYRETLGAEVLEIFHRTTAESVTRLRALSTDQWEVVGWSPEGERPYHRFMETRVLDSWIHLQDIRDALLEPADDHGAGEEIVLNRFEGSLPYVLGKRVAPAEGTVVRLNLSGRLGRSILLVLRDGRALTVESSDDPPDVELTTPVALFWRRAAGRISSEAFLRASATEVRGDAGLARRLADELAVMI